MKIILNTSDLRGEHSNCHADEVTFWMLNNRAQAVVRAAGEATIYTDSGTREGTIRPPQQKSSLPIVLSVNNYQQELDEMSKKGELPAELARLLKALVNSHLRKSISPTATPTEVKQAWEYLSGGIFLRQDGSDGSFHSAAVFEPDPELAGTARIFLQLVRRCPLGKIVIFE
ncbi:MAG: hypothetical protein WC250_00075 [Candidatus Paceibacterota bacterium]|jgi:hypothetical protein